MFKNKKGFTLLEILLVVGIIAVLAGIVIIAINPSKQLATVRNTQRKSNLAEINKAVQQYYIDNSTYPGGTSLVSTLTEICNTGAIPATTTSVTGAPCGTLTNLSDLVPTYLVAIPVDPQGSPIALLTNIAHADTLGTGYQIMKDANNKIALNSQGAELGAVITLGPVAVSNPVAGCVATGGIETTISGYKIHTFATVGSDTFTVTSGSCDAEVLVVAGGGGGGVANPGNAGGGGAGGLISTSTYLLSSVTGTYNLSVGAGGLIGSNGENSSFDNLLAYGGGYGAPWQDGVVIQGGDGGSGGGSGQAGPPNPVVGAGYPGQGHNGGNTSGSISGAGGGGAGGVGGDSSVYALGTHAAGSGGIGVQNSITGSPVWYAGGGSGSAHSWAAGPTNGGNGGGGTGQYKGTPGTAGTNGLGGGGGGGGEFVTGGSGGSGVVIVRYAI